MAGSGASGHTGLLAMESWHASRSRCKGGGAHTDTHTQCSRVCSWLRALPVGEVRLLPAPTRQHEPLLSVAGIQPIRWVRHATAGPSGAPGRTRSLLCSGGRCQAAGRSFMPGLWPPPHHVAVVGVLGRREDGGEGRAGQASTPHGSLLGLWAVSTHTQPRPLCLWAGRGREKACSLPHCRPIGMSGLVS